jgi:hypothetical protein
MTLRISTPPMTGLGVDPIRPMIRERRLRGRALVSKLSTGVEENNQFHH